MVLGMKKPAPAAPPVPESREVVAAAVLEASAPFFDASCGDIQHMAYLFSALAKTTVAAEPAGPALPLDLLHPCGCWWSLF